MVLTVSFYDLSGIWYCIITSFFKLHYWIWRNVVVLYIMILNVVITYISQITAVVFTKLISYIYMYILRNDRSIYFNIKRSSLQKLNCYPLEGVSHYRDPQLQVITNYLRLSTRVVVSTAAFHARVRGSFPGLGVWKKQKCFFPMLS